ncbi:MAG: cbb3-type cytochrome oxidase assembly protein CcoS [Gemmatimonadota bacterium]
MNGLLVILGVALFVGMLFAGMFWYAVRSGQFDDMDDPPRRMLKD